MDLLRHKLYGEVSFARASTSDSVAECQDAIKPCIPESSLRRPAFRSGCVRKQRSRLDISERTPQPRWNTGCKLCAVERS
jgi:hypothetical protein